MHEKKLWKIYLVCLLVLSAVFVALYHPFLFDGQMYAYSDVGADTIDQYLPVMIYETNRLRDGVLEGYDLQYGLGKYTGGYLLKYLNPVNLPILLLGEEHLPEALMISLYLKYALICLFALLFFTRLLKNEKAAAICSLLWTFSGYAVLWGQHYQFLNAIVCFTAVMYCFQLFLEEDRKSFWVVPAVAYLAVTSYYHLYIACYFLLAYGILYLAFQGRSVRYILKRAGLFALGMLAAVLMAGCYLLPVFIRFLNSPRVEQVTGGYSMDSLMYSWDTLTMFLSRLLSNDLLGVGDEFLGPTNYYECAILSVSVLSLFAFVYLMLSRHWKKVLGVSIVCVLALCVPQFSQLVVFSTTAMRWTYLLCFVEVIAIGVAFADIANRRNEEGFSKVVLRAVIGADLLLAVLLAVLYQYHIHVGGWLLNEKACLVLAAIVVMYHGALLMIKKSRRVFAIVMALVAVELVLMNYASVNDRETVSVQQWWEDMYYDGTEEVVQWIREQDDSLYRINKTYTSVSYCDSLVQAYDGMGIYYSLNSSELINLARDYGYEWAGNRVSFDGTNYLANSMLGVKYIITEENTQMDSLLYEEIYNDGSHKVYRNRYWLGFGHLYALDSRMSESAVENSTVLEKASLMSEYYYITGCEEAPVSVEAEREEVDILGMLSGYEQCDIYMDDRLQVFGTGVNMQLYFSLPELDPKWMVSGVRIRMTAENASAVTMYTSEDGSVYEEELCHTVYYGSGEQEIYLNNMVSNDVTNVRLDISWVPQYLVIEELTLILVERDSLCQNLQILQNTSVTNMVQDDSFSADVNNTGDSAAMLCVPLVYSDNWAAEVDGQAVDLININGGLLGLEIGPGTHKIEFTYQDDNDSVGLMISLVSSVAYFFAVLVWMKRAKRPDQNI